MIRKEGYIDIEEMLKEIGIDTTDLKTILDSPLITREPNVLSIVFSFSYHSQKYYYKYSPFTNPYNELVCKELVKDYGYPYIDYDLATLKGGKGVLSPSFIKENARYVSGEEILSDFWEDNINVETHNNLEDIWDALEYRYQNHHNKKQIIEHLMDRIIGVFIFDIITCQNDRLSPNWQIVEEDDCIDIAPLYDNARILTTNQINPSVALTLDSNIQNNLLNTLDSFEKVSDKKYTKLLKEKIWIISEKNLESVFKRIETQTSYPMPENIKDYYLNEFRIHRNRLLTREENIRKR